MVEYFDPIQQKNISYHLDNKIKVRLDRIKQNLVKKDEDRVFIIDGMERSGKSVFTFQLAKYVDPTFSVDRVCFTPEAFLRAIRTADKGQAVVFDEAFRGLSSKSSISKINREIVQAMMEMGQKNLIVFIVLPTFFLLEVYAAVLRSWALFHIYKDSKGKRAFRVYNYRKKSLLYFTGKKKGFDYSQPKSYFNGRFFNIYTINEDEYRKKKSQALEQIIPIEGEEKENVNSRWQVKSNEYLKHLVDFVELYKESSGKTYDVIAQEGKVPRSTLATWRKVALSGNQVTL